MPTDFPALAVVGHELRNIIGVPGGRVGICECSWSTGTMGDVDGIRGEHRKVHLTKVEPRLFP